MKTRHAPYLALAFVLGISRSIAADQPAQVTEVFNEVHHGATESTATTSAKVGTPVYDGEYVKTGMLSRAELQLPTASITRLGANTIFNYSVESNTVDLQEGTILFCKPKGPGVPRLNVKTAAVTAGIIGTTGFFHVYTNTTTHQTTTIFGLVEGHATATAGGAKFPVGPGDILEFTPGSKPFVFAFDVPRFVKSSPLLTKFGQLPNQSYIDAEIASYRDDVRRGFIQPPSHAIDYTGEGIPVLSTPAYDSAMNAQGQPKGNAGNPTGDKPSFPSNSGPGR